MFQTEIGIPRHAAGPRQVARAGEIWRLFQELAIQASAEVGWSPDRYLEQGTAFVIYGMTTTHAREVRYGERLQARTWVHDFKRDTLTRRQVRLRDEHGPVAAGTQQWVHVDAHLKPVRAPQSLLSALPPEVPDEPSIALPEWERCTSGPVHTFAFSPWHTWMDPLAHVNHPAYVDFCDEGTSRVLAAAGVDPQLLVPVAEHLAFKVGALAGQQVEVRTRLVGRAPGGAAVLEHEIGGEAGFARGLTIRRRADGQDLALCFG